VPLFDDLGTRVELARPVRRVVSLVPSLTEALAATVPERLVGATDWCTHPENLDVTRVRGTKNPDRGAIQALRPDLVVANQEENRRVDVERLRVNGIAVWVTVIESVDAAVRSMHRLFNQALDIPAPGWLRDSERAWAQPLPPTGQRVVVPVWRDPWMVVGSQTFTGDVVHHLGLTNLYRDHPQRYPQVTLDELGALAPDLVLLPDEPYRFTAADGPEAFPGCAVALVSGRLLTWYGPSLRTAQPHLLQQVRTAR